MLLEAKYKGRKLYQHNPDTGESSIINSRVNFAVGSIAYRNKHSQIVKNNTEKTTQRV